MPKSATEELVKYLKQAHAMEKQSALLLERGSDIAGDTEIAAIYRAHLLQTQEHARYVDERLQAHGESPSKVRDVAMQAGALGIGLAAQAAPDTPVRLAATAFAFENLEVASYQLLRRLAERAGDADTVSVAEAHPRAGGGGGRAGGRHLRPSARGRARGARRKPSDPGHADRKAVRASRPVAGGHGVLAVRRHGPDWGAAGRRGRRRRAGAAAAAPLAAVALLGPAPGAGAHTLYYGPARGAALRVAAATQAAVTADPDIPAVGTGHGVSGCRRTSRHSWRCRIWVSARGLGGQTLRCEQGVVARYVSTVTRVIRVATIGRPVCR